MSVSDPEAQGSSVTVVQKRPLRAVSTRRRIPAVAGSVARVCDGERAVHGNRARTDAPFLRASVGEGSLGRDVETLARLGARERRRHREGTGGASAWSSPALRQHGFGEAELERREEGPVIASYERAYNERDKQQTGGLASELVRHFLSGSLRPASLRSSTSYAGSSPTITTAEAAAVFRDALKDDNGVVIAVSPAKEGLRR